jgi:hypothetical protein
MVSSSGEGVVCGPSLVGLSVAEHGEQDVDAAAGEADEGGVVAFALGDRPTTAAVGAGSRPGKIAAWVVLNWPWCCVIAKR